MWASTRYNDTQIHELLFRNKWNSIQCWLLEIRINPRAKTRDTEKKGMETYEENGLKFKTKIIFDG